MEKAQKIKILTLTAIAIVAVFVLDYMQPAHADYYQDAQRDAEMQNYRLQQEYRQREYEAQLQELRQQQYQREYNEWQNRNRQSESYSQGSGCSQSDRLAAGFATAGGSGRKAADWIAAGCPK